ncbi:MAG: hypothetical protein HQK60_01755 [Deltaproteobacteria bacterium]|nr:hypothetical protein [Deltaproteobacteria bacterium]
MVKTVTERTLAWAARQAQAGKKNVSLWLEPEVVSILETLRQPGESVNATVNRVIKGLYHVYINVASARDRVYINESSKPASVYVNEQTVVAGVDMNVQTNDQPVSPASVQINEQASEIADTQSVDINDNAAEEPVDINEGQIAEPVQINPAEVHINDQVIPTTVDMNVAINELSPDEAVQTNVDINDQPNVEPVDINAKDENIVQINGQDVQPKEVECCLGGSEDDEQESTPPVAQTKEAKPPRPKSAKPKIKRGGPVPITDEDWQALARLKDIRDTEGYNKVQDALAEWLSKKRDEGGANNYLAKALDKAGIRTSHKVGEWKQGTVGNMIDKWREKKAQATDE